MVFSFLSSLSLDMPMCLGLENSFILDFSLFCFSFCPPGSARSDAPPVIVVVVLLVVDGSALCGAGVLGKATLAAVVAAPAARPPPGLLW